MGFRGLAIGIFFVFLTGFGSCDGSLKQACSGRIPELEKVFDDAILALGPWNPSAPSPEGARSVASVDAPGQVPDSLAEMDRQSWMKWAEDRLEEAQGFLDLAESEPRISSIRKELSFMANEIVSFHGYSERGEPVRMISSLAKVREHARRVRVFACPQ